MEKISASFEPSFELISHPDRSLHTHLASCDVISKNMLALKYINADVFYPADLLETMRHLLVYFHDFGKGSFFQLKIIDATETATDNAIFKKAMQPYIDFFNQNRRVIFEKEIEKQNRLGNHAKLGSYFVLPNFEHEDWIIRFILLKIIQRHHGNLTNFFVSRGSNKLQIQLDDDSIAFLEKQIEQQDFELYQNILNEQNLTTNKSSWEKIKTDLSSGRRFVKIQSALENQKEVKYFFLQHYLFSLLLSADKGDMMLNGDMKRDLAFLKNHQLPLSIIDNFKTWKHKDQEPRPIDRTREEAYRMVADNAHKYRDKAFFSITLPTGLGKTYAAYNTAVILQNAFVEQTGQVPRIVYVLPFTSIIDQNEAILREIMSNTEGVDCSWLSKNHYLSDYNKRYDDSELLTKDEPEYLADGWEHDIIVTTFVQFLEGIFTDRNRLLRKFHNMTNTVFILDEVQNIPPQYFEAIELVFRKMNAYFNTKFVFVTATQPFLFRNKEDVQELADPKKYFQGLERITLDQTLLKENGKMEIVDFIEILIEDIDNQLDKSFLIICNTIKSSQMIYDKLTEQFGEVLYLSSSILPFLRIEVIDKIKKTKGRQIVVSTQVVEAGVDIDLDIVYRDFAPVDSINQSAGRCNRNGEKGNGMVKLFDLNKARYIYDKVLLNLTDEILRGYQNHIPEAQLYDLNLSYAKAVRERKAEANDASLALIEAMQELRTEDIANSFKLIEDDYRNYNVFIPVDDKAEAIWKQYQERCRTEDDFERKRKIKEIKPALLQYVTRFPKNKYVPPKGKEDNSIIYVENWKEEYDLKTGFKYVEEKMFII